MSAKKIVGGKYAVCADAHRHTAIKVGETPKYVLLIPLGPVGLVVTKLSHERYAAEWAEVLYPLKKAVSIFLDSPIGKSSSTTSEARGHLEAILSSDVPDATSGPLPDYLKDINMTTTAKKTVAKKTASKKEAPAAKAKADKKTAVAAKPADDKVLKKGSVDFTTECRAGSIRFARMEFIVKSVGKKVSEVIGKAIDKEGTVIEPINMANAIKNKFVSV